MPVKKYREELLEQLRDPEEAAAYLTACFEESEEVFLLGLRQVAEAHGGMNGLSKKTELNREYLYRMLSRRGNPKIRTLSAILEACGLTIQFKAA